MTGKRKAVVCSIPGCGNRGYITRGMCKMHYKRWLKNGEPGPAAKMHAVTNAGKTCTVDGCSKPVRAIGYCAAHYKRNRRWGDPLGGRRARTFAESFELYVVRTNDCWEWSGTKYRTGYTKLASGRKQILGHRWAYEHYRGEIPSGMVIDHLCRNRGCVNPAHMEVVTNEENLRRGAGYAIQNGMRSTCINGHEYTPENTYVEPNGKNIRCRACAAERAKKRKRAA
ncbi:HNH endonuclease signature motif containing protein [Corynebacterium sp. MSK071]|uniref:HNH endonuclease signature motif containing protein n=1 Tax=Corynebacterium sp. MSK071 TaxID=3377090 RepID=UPI0037BFF121